MPYQSKLQSPDLDRLFEAILTLESVEELYRFMEDLTTIQELKEMGQRFHVASLLDRKLPYHKIAETTSASTATISRVNKSLVYGAGGYRLALDRLQTESE
jgi:TrpR-related protein YerC/YecD